MIQTMSHVEAACSPLPASLTFHLSWIRAGSRIVNLSSRAHYGGAFKWTDDGQLTQHPTWWCVLRLSLPAARRLSQVAMLPMRKLAVMLRRCHICLHLLIASLQLYGLHPCFTLMPACPIIGSRNTAAQSWQTPHRLQKCRGGGASSMALLPPQVRLGVLCIWLGVLCIWLGVLCI
jgi:hypothetical protein